jgi:hypothetical protein
MDQQEEVPSLSTNLMNIIVFFYTSLYPCKIGANVGVDIIRNKELLALVENPISSFIKNQNFYENEVFPKATFQIIKLILVDMIVYFNIFGRKIFTPTCLVSVIIR